MTTTRTTEALEVYRQYPMDDGDVVLLLDERVCLELEQASAEPDREVLLDVLARTLVGACASVVLAVARARAAPRPEDLLLWADLCTALQGSGVQLLPLAVLPAAPRPRRAPTLHP